LPYSILVYSNILCFGYGITQNLVDAIYWAKGSKVHNFPGFGLFVAQHSKQSTLSLSGKELAFVMTEGIAFEFGINRKPSYSKAFEKYVIAAEGDISSAMVVVGKMYKIGIGVKYDLRESQKWCLKAVVLLNFHGIREIGM
jgi:TPR repeat protein